MLQRNTLYTMCAKTGALLPVWLGGALLLMLSLIGARWHVVRIRQSGSAWPRGQPLVRALAADAGVGRRIEVLLHEQILTPMTCGTWRPAILLPSDAPRWGDSAAQGAGP